MTSILDVNHVGVYDTFKVRRRHVYSFHYISVPKLGKRHPEIFQAVEEEVALDEG
jgi:hypothetical protein